MIDKELIEKVASALWHNNHGSDDAEWWEIVGEPRLPWAEVEEHTKDDFRAMAEVAIRIAFPAGLRAAAEMCRKASVSAGIHPIASRVHAMNVEWFESRATKVEKDQ